MVLKKLFKKQSHVVKQAVESKAGKISQSQEVATQTTFSNARSAHHKGNYQEAIDLYSKVIAANPTGLPMTYFYRAECYRELGETEKAEKDLATYKEVTAAPPAAQ